MTIEQKIARAYLDSIKGANIYLQTLEQTKQLEMASYATIQPDRKNLGFTALLNVLEREINEVKDEIQNRCVIINTLPSECWRTMLIRHYIYGDTWGNIALDLHYCEKTIYRMRAAALDALGQYLTDNLDVSNSVSNF